MKVQITLDVPKLTRTDDAQEYALDLVNHIADTFNDDCSIRTFWTKVPKVGKERAA